MIQASNEILMFDTFQAYIESAGAVILRDVQGSSLVPVDMNYWLKMKFRSIVVLGEVSYVATIPSLGNFDHCQQWLRQLCETPARSRSSGVYRLTGLL